MSRLTRLLIALAFCLLLAIGVLFLVDGRSMSLISQVEIAVPPEVVFRYLTDPEIWARGSGALQVRSLNDGGHHVGAKAQIEVVRPPNWVVISEVLESLPNERLIHALTTAQLSARSDIRLQEVDGVTTMRHTIILEPRGTMRLIAPFARQRLQEQQDAALVQLKTWIERDSIQPAPETNSGNTLDEME